MTQAYNLSQLANNLNSAGQLDATDGLVNAVPAANGGTGVNNLASAAALFGDLLFPVGSTYTNVSNATNPATLLGFGTWTSLGAGRMLVGYSAGDPVFGTVGNTGGSRDAIVVSHTHTGTTNTTGAHVHTYNTKSSTLPQSGSATQVWVGDTSANTGSAGDHSHTLSVNSSGSSGTNANLPPYLTVYMWQRTA